MSVVEIAPIVKSIDVRRSAGDAFRAFTAEISACRLHFDTLAAGLESSAEASS